MEGLKSTSPKLHLAPSAKSATKCSSRYPALIFLALVISAWETTGRESSLQCPFSGAPVTVKKHIHEDQHHQIAEMITGLTTQQLNSGACELRAYIRVKPGAVEQPNPSR